VDQYASVYIRMVKWIVASQNHRRRRVDRLSEEGAKFCFETSATTVLDVAVQETAL
jgi:hypothetical protein